MNLHEYQAREILKRAGVPMPDAAVAATADEARTTAARLGGKVVVKSQVTVRAKAGEALLELKPR